MNSLFLSLAAFLACSVGLAIWFSNSILIATILLRENQNTHTTRGKKFVITMRAVPNAVAVLMAFLLGFVYNDLRQFQNTTQKAQIVEKLKGEAHVSLGSKSKSGL